MIRNDFVNMLCLLGNYNVLENYFVFIYENDFVIMRKLF